MPTVSILKKHKIIDTFRVSGVKGQFDIDIDNVVHETNIDINLPEKWSIGCIIGASGSGKTILADEIFNEYNKVNYVWKENCFLDDFDKGIEYKEITKTLNSVGFSSPPQWLLPFKLLSNGQKFRVELARIILDNKPSVFDEFTSFVDRDVSKICCSAIRKIYDREAKAPLVCVTCHYDVIDWLDPDWIIDVSTSTFTCGRQRHRPKIEIEIYECERSMWQIFKKYHYLDHDINKASKCYVGLYNNRPICFTAVLHMPHPKVNNFRREHRTVVLPDFQGVGIGNKFSDAIANMYVKNGYRYISITTNPAMMYSRSKNKNWVTTRFGINSQLSPTSSVTGMRKTVSYKRKTASFEYVGGLD